MGTFPSLREFTRGLAAMGRTSEGTSESHGPINWPFGGHPYKLWLVGALEHFLLVHVLGMMVQSDSHIFGMGWNHHTNCDFGVGCIYFYEQFSHFLVNGIGDMDRNIISIPKHPTIWPLIIWTIILPWNLILVLKLKGTREWDVKLEDWIIPLIPSVWKH